MTHKKLRDYYKGEMYQTLEDEFTSAIWGKWTVYYSYQSVGDTAAAKQYKANNPDLEAYSEMKKELNKAVTENMLAFGETIPEGTPMSLREDFVPDNERKGMVEDFFNEPEPRSYTIPDWVEIIGQEETLLAKWAYEGLVLPADIRGQLQGSADLIGMSFEDLLIAIGTSPER